MPIEYVLKHPQEHALTLTLFDDAVVTKIGEPATQKFASPQEAASHLQRAIFLYQKRGYVLAETREIEDTREIENRVELPDLTIEVDPQKRRVTLTLGSDYSDERIEPGEVPPLSAATLEVVVACLQKEEPRSIHVICEPASPGSQLTEFFNVSLEAFIFDAPGEYIDRQSSNTLGDINGILETCTHLQRIFVTGFSTMRVVQHRQIREIYLLGLPLHDSVIPALGGCEFPALETLVLMDETGIKATDLARSLGSIGAPRLSSLYVYGVELLEFLAILGNASLPWNLCILAPHFTDMDGLLEVLRGYEALRSPKLRFDFGDKTFLEEDIEQLVKMGIGIEDVSARFLPDAYREW